MSEIPDTSTLPPGYRVEEYSMHDGRKGVIVRQPNGLFARGTQPPNVITTANARDYARARVETHRQAAAEALLQQAIDNGLLDKDALPAAAWGVLVARVAEQIMDSDRPRGDDMLAVGRAIGAILPAGERNQDDNAAGNDWQSFLSQAIAARVAITASVTVSGGDTTTSGGSGDVIDAQAADVPASEPHRADVLDLSTLTDDQRSAIAAILAGNQPVQPAQDAPGQPVDPV